MSDLGAWLFALTALVVIGFAFLAVMGGAIGLGVVLPSALVVTSLFVAIVVVDQVIYDIGGETYARYSFWISVAWATLSLTWLVGLGCAIGNSTSHWQTIRLRAIWPLAVYAVGAILVCGIWSWPNSLSRHGDTAMIQHFDRHEAEFDRLAEMFAQDSQISAICGPGRAGWPGLTAERAAEYEAVLGAVDLRHGLVRTPHGESLLRYWTKPATGLADQNTEKGYTRLDSPPSRLVGSLDDHSALGQGLAYRHISGRWHLYYYNRDSLRATCDLSARMNAPRSDHPDRKFEMSRGTWIIDSGVIHPIGAVIAP